MRIFLDTSVLLAACGSERGASREIFRRAGECGWLLISTPYVVREVLNNLPELSAEATFEWSALKPELTLVDDVVTLDRASVFEPAKDRPIFWRIGVVRCAADT